MSLYDDRILQVLDYRVKSIYLSDELQWSELVIINSSIRKWPDLALYIAFKVNSLNIQEQDITNQMVNLD